MRAAGPKRRRDRQKGERRQQRQQIIGAAPAETVGDPSGDRGRDHEGRHQPDEDARRANVHLLRRGGIGDEGQRIGLDEGPAEARQAAERYRHGEIGGVGESGAEQSEAEQPRLQRPLAAESVGQGPGDDGEAAHRRGHRRPADRRSPPATRRNPGPLRSSAARRRPPPSRPGTEPRPEWRADRGSSARFRHEGPTDGLNAPAERRSGTKSAEFRRESAR